jgi:hypothetical protein
MLAAVAWLLGSWLARSPLIAARDAPPPELTRVPHGHPTPITEDKPPGTGQAGAGSPVPSPQQGDESGAPSVYHPRDPHEWQGMPVDMTLLQPYCSRPQDCGMALGCLGALGCGPCTPTAGCSRDEVCVLDHCVPKRQASCRSYRDCPQGELCLLTGISPDPRGNAGMAALCTGELKEKPETPHPPHEARSTPFRAPNEDLRRAIESEPPR